MSLVQVALYGGENHDRDAALSPLDSDQLPDQVKEMRDAIIALGSRAVGVRPHLWWPRKLNTVIGLTQPFLLYKTFWDGTKWRYFAVDATPTLYELFMPDESDTTNNGMVAVEVTSSGVGSKHIDLLGGLPLDGIACPGGIFILNGGNPTQTGFDYHTCYRCAIKIAQNSRAGQPMPWEDTGDQVGTNQGATREEWGNNRFPNCRTAVMVGPYVVAAGIWSQPLEPQQGDDGHVQNSTAPTSQRGANQSVVRWSLPMNPTGWRRVDWKPVYPDDGDTITKTEAFQDRTVFFKSYNLYTLNGNIPPWDSSSIIARHGCPFPETVQRFEGGLIYLNDHLDPMFWNGEGEPVKLTHPALDEYLHQSRASWALGAGQARDNFDHNTVFTACHKRESDDAIVPDKDSGVSEQVFDGNELGSPVENIVCRRFRQQFILYNKWGGGDVLLNAGYIAKARIRMSLLVGAGKRKVHFRIGRNVEVPTSGPDPSSYLYDCVRGPVHIPSGDAYTDIECEFPVGEWFVAGGSRWVLEVHIDGEEVFNMKVVAFAEINPRAYWVKLDSGDWEAGFLRTSFFEVRGYPVIPVATVKRLSPTPFHIENLYMWDKVWFDQDVKEPGKLYIALKGSPNGTSMWQTQIVTSNGTQITIPDNCKYLMWTAMLSVPSRAGYAILKTPITVGYYTTSGDYDVRRIPSAAIYDGRYVLATCASDSDYNNRCIVIQPEHPNAPGVLGQNTRPIIMRWANIETNHFCLITLDRVYGKKHWRENYLSWAGLDTTADNNGGFTNDVIVVLGRHQADAFCEEFFAGATKWYRSGRSNPDFYIESHRIPVVPSDGIPRSSFLRALDVMNVEGKVQDYLVEVVGKLSSTIHNVLSSSLPGSVDDGIPKVYRLALDSATVALIIRARPGVEPNAMIRRLAVRVDAHEREYDG